MIRVLFLSDTHLGFDQPIKPKIVRRRRGPDFFRNYHRALQAGIEGEVDLVIHGGDMFFRSRVPTIIASLAYEPLIQIAEQGIPVIIVPGNHERSRLPYPLFLQHSNIHVFDVPTRQQFSINNHRISIVGFPFMRQIAQHMPGLLLKITDPSKENDISIIVLHQVIAGATVGPSDYMFRYGNDVIPTTMLPEGHAAVLCGHIHRHQVIRYNLDGRQLPYPILFAGSTTRTSFAEADETKGYIVAKFDRSSSPGGVLRSSSFFPLPSRPMVTINLAINGKSDSYQVDQLVAKLSQIDENSLVRLLIDGCEASQQRGTEIFSAPVLRSIAPETMNISLGIPHQRFRLPKGHK